MKDEYVETGRKNQKLETRNKILAGAQYFLNKGLNFNLQDVAKHSGVSRATIYRYFSNPEILALEAGLDLNTQSPETIYSNLKGENIEDKIFEVQDYFNILAIDRENAFRKYLSTVLASSSSEVKRGARRNKALQLVLESTSLTPKEKTDLANLLTMLMGIEALIVTKDVSGLNDEESIHLMKWGMELLLKGFNASKNGKLEAD